MGSEKTDWEFGAGEGASEPFWNVGSPIVCVPSFYKKIKAIGKQLLVQIST